MNTSFGPLACYILSPRPPVVVLSFPCTAELLPLRCHPPSAGRKHSLPLLLSLAPPESKQPHQTPAGISTWGGGNPRAASMAKCRL